LAYFDLTIIGITFATIITIAKRGEAKKNITDAIKLFLEDLNADGEEIPARNSNIFIGQVSVSNPLIH